MPWRHFLFGCALSACVASGSGEGGTSGDGGAGQTDDAEPAPATDAGEPVVTDGGAEDRPEPVLPDAPALPEDRPEVPSCGNAGSACNESTGCCSGLLCIGGVCGTCSDTTAPQFCPEYGGICWRSEVVCSTIRDCGGRLSACRNPILTPNCATNQCECPAAYPVFCAANGAMPESCWTAGTDCATRTVCGDQVYACNAGRRLNCSTLLCDATTPTTPPTPPMATPWIVRTFYLRPAYTENNVRFGSNVRSVEFRADGTYHHTLASNPSTNGRYVVNGTRLTFPTGTLSSTTLDLNTSFSSSCRVLAGLGSPPLWSPAEVPACPSFNRVTQNECQYVGTYTRTSRSGSISGSGSGSETETTDTVRLYRDHFYTVDFSSSRRTCFSSRCTTLYSTSQTRVGTWSVAAGADTFSLAVLRGAAWRFTRSTTACPGP